MINLWFFLPNTTRCFPFGVTQEQRRFLHESYHIHRWDVNLILAHAAKKGWAQFVEEFTIAAIKARMLE